MFRSISAMPRLCVGCTDLCIRVQAYICVRVDEWRRNGGMTEAMFMLSELHLTPGPRQLIIAITGFSKSLPYPHTFSLSGLLLSLCTRVWTQNKCRFPAYIYPLHFPLFEIFFSVSCTRFLATFSWAKSKNFWCGCVCACAWVCVPTGCPTVAYGCQTVTAGVLEH